MKKIIVTIIFLAVLLHGAFAQFILDEDGKPQPFSLQPPYREMIKPETMAPNYVTKAYDNDSLLIQYNPPGSKDLTSGIVIDSTKYEFKKVANHFDLGHGDLWIYKITSPTSKEITIEFNDFKIPQGALFCFYQLNGSNPFNQDPDVFHSGNERFFLGSAGRLGNELFIEYYEPKGIRNPLNIIFKYIGYGFTDGLGVRLEDIPKKKVEAEQTNLKSGYWGFSNYSCNNTLPCSIVSQWNTPSKSVAFLFIQTKIVNGSFKTIKGTGFFVNKGNSYIADDYPYIITCGHAFKNGIDKSIYQYLYVNVNYEDQVCNDTYIRAGSNVGSYDIIKIGTTIDPSASGYSESEDYALLKSDKKVSELAKSNILYAGWAGNYSFSNSKTGYTYIGHPGGNVKTVNTETSFAVQNGSTNFRLTNKVGVNETGFSGSPVFYSADRNVVGWVCTEGTGNYNCGDGNQSTYCGLFRELYFKINSYIDPTNNGSATTTQPTEVSLPAHCKNCIKDGDETDIDCGGSCQPCGMADDLSIVTSNDIYRSNLKSRFKISFGNGNSMINLKPGNYELNAGQSIILKSCKISDGATLKANVNQTQIYEPFKGCQSSCFSPISLSCNGDYVPVVINQAFVKSSYFKVYDRWGGYVYTSPTYYFYENGQFFTQDLVGIISNATFILIHYYTDCNGNQNTAQSVLTVGCLGCKSAEILTSSEPLNPTNPFSVFPNPACDYINVFVASDSPANEFYAIEIYSINGKLLKNIKVRENLNTVDISDLLSGTYIIGVKTSTNNFYEKFIKE